MDPPHYPLTVDIVIFTIKDEDLQVLLIKRKYEPFKNMWAIPGGFVLPKEGLEQSARRELQEETGLKDVFLEQLYTFGGVDRDPRGRIITVTYFALIDSGKITLRGGSDATDARWFNVFNLPALGFDHREILEYALKRLRYKLEYTTIGFELLPKKFTLTQVQQVYETILHKKVDKRNFRKKILSLGLLEGLNELSHQRVHRPAQLFRLKKMNAVFPRSVI